MSLLTLSPHIPYHPPVQLKTSSLQTEISFQLSKITALFDERVTNQLEYTFDTGYFSKWFGRYSQVENVNFQNRLADDVTGTKKLDLAPSDNLGADEELTQSDLEHTQVDIAPQETTPLKATLHESEETLLAKLQSDGANVIALLSEVGDDGLTRVHRAATLGQFEVIRWIVTHKDENVRSTLLQKDAQNRSVARCAILSKQLKIVSFLLTLGTGGKQWKWVLRLFNRGLYGNHYPYYDVAQTGQVPMLDLLKKHGIRGCWLSDLVEKFQYVNIARIAAFYGNIAVLNWISNQEDKEAQETLSKFSWNDISLLDYAILGGQLAVLEWVANHKNKEVQALLEKNIWTSFSLKKFVEHSPDSMLEIIQQIWSHPNPLIKALILKYLETVHSLVHRAAVTGDLEVLKWLSKIKDPRVLEQFFNRGAQGYNLVHDVMVQVHLDVLEFLYNEPYLSGLFMQETSNGLNLAHIAAYTNEPLKALQWIYDQEGLRHLLSESSKDQYEVSKDILGSEIKKLKRVGGNLAQIAKKLELKVVLEWIKNHPDPEISSMDGELPIYL